MALLDLCCGPGSITWLALSRFDAVTVTACDIDPWLVEMGRRTLGDDPRVRWLEADVRAAGWAQSLPTGGFNAVLSPTALHWLHRDELVRLFDELGQAGRAGWGLPERRPLAGWSRAHRDDRARPQAGRVEPEAGRS
jgi:trans-aconitate methyltransferase